MIINNPYPIEEDSARFKAHISVTNSYLSQRPDRKSTKLADMIDKTDDMLTKCANAICSITHMKSVQFDHDPEETELKQASLEVLKRIGTTPGAIQSVITAYRYWLIDLTELKEKLKEWQQLPESPYVPAEDWFRPLTRVGKSTVKTKEQLLDFFGKVCREGDYIEGTVYFHGRPAVRSFSSLSELSHEYTWFEDIIALGAQVNVRNGTQSLIISLENAEDGFKILRSKRQVFTESFLHQQEAHKLLHVWLNNPEITVEYKTRSLLRTYLKAVLNTFHYLPGPMFESTRYKNLVRMYYHFSKNTSYLPTVYDGPYTLNDPLTLLASIGEDFGVAQVTERGTITFARRDV